jgi:hypothetical protein
MKFHIGDIIAVDTGILVGPNKSRGIIQIAQFLYGDHIDTQLYCSDGQIRVNVLRALRIQVPFLSAKYYLADVKVFMEALQSPYASTADKDKLVENFINQCITRYGEAHELETML